MMRFPIFMYGDVDPALEPIFIITPSGRTGTTLLMSLLLQHRQIVAEPSYPYELRINQVRLPESSLSAQDVLCYPFGDLAEEKAAYFSEMPDRWKDGRAYYEWLAQRIGKDGRYMLEKLVGFSVDKVKAVYPTARFLVSMRDPRDTLISARNFDATRGVFGFVERLGDSDLDVVQRTGRNLNALLDLIGRDDCLFVKYEQLVDRPRDILNGITGWLGLDPLTDPVVGSYLHHRTSLPATASIGRWRHEMDPTLQALCATWWRRTLEMFGYATK